jgi:hypothetical protein
MVPIYLTPCTTADLAKILKHYLVFTTIDYFFIRILWTRNVKNQTQLIIVRLWTFFIKGFCVIFTKMLCNYRAMFFKT